MEFSLRNRFQDGIFEMLKIVSGVSDLGFYRPDLQSAESKHVSTGILY